MGFEYRKKQSTVSEDDVIAALTEKPLTLYMLRKRFGSEEELRILLVRMRDAGKVAFNINSGQWSVAR